MADRLMELLDVERGVFVSSESLRTVEQLFIDSLNSQYSDSTLFAEFIVGNSEVIRSLWESRLGFPSKKGIRSYILKDGVGESVIEGLKHTSPPKIRMPTVWPILGNNLAKGVAHSYLSGTNPPEWRVQGILGLAHFFYHCKLNKIRDVCTLLETQSGGLHGPRGGFLALAHKLDPIAGIEDLSIPLVSRQSRRPKLKSKDPFLVKMACREASEWAKGRGVLSRVLNQHRNSLNRYPSGSSKANQKELKQGRKRYDSQYAACINGYLYIISMEQILRSCAEECGIAHMREETPKSVESWVQKLGLSENVIGDIMMVFSSKKANIRNRVLHCGLLDPGPRAQEARLSDLELGRVANKSTSPESPENIAVFCELALGRLLDDVRQKGMAITDLDWTKALLPTHQQIEFGKRLNCSILESKTSFTGWYVRICHFLEVNMPCMGMLPNLTLFNLLAGLNTTRASQGETSYSNKLDKLRQKSRPEQFMLFLSYGLIFEALYRHVASLHNHSILQHPTRPEKSLAIQYRMLDARQLSSDTVIDSIVECIATEGQVYAKRCLLSVIRMRNALSHGAILSYDDEVHFSYNNLFVNAIQLLVDSGIHAMTKKRAYFEWKEKRNGEHGFHDDDYFTARSATFEMLEKYGNLQDHAWIYNIEDSMRNET